MLSTMKHLVLFVTLIKFTLTIEQDFFDDVVFPSTIQVPIDGSVYIKVKNPVESQTTCAYKAPRKNELNPPDTSVKFSEDKCGIRIDRVLKSHAGAWQLISTFKNSTYETSIKGLAILSVRESTVIVKPDHEMFSYEENFAPEGVDMSYCYVSRSLGFLKMSDIEMSKCMIPKGLMSTDFQDGEWNVRMGVIGETKEVSYSVNIRSKGKRAKLSLLSHATLSSAKIKRSN